MKDINYYIEHTYFFPVLALIPIGVLTIQFSWKIGVIGGIVLPLVGICVMHILSYLFRVPRDLLAVDSKHTGFAPLLVFILPIVLWEYFGVLAITVFFAIRNRERGRIA